MPDLRLAVTALLLIAGGHLFGQPANDDCADATEMCAQQSIAGDNTGALNTIPAFCQPGGSTVWYSFTTNSQGGAVSVEVSGLDCPSIPGMDNEMSAVILTGDGSCTPSSFTAVSSCAHDSVDFTVTSTQALLPATQYWVMVGGLRDNGATIAAQCGFNIQVSGPGADVVGVDFTAGPDATIPAGGSTQLNATGGTGYVWSPTSGLSGNTTADPVAQPNESTIYSVTTQIGNCTYTDSVNVEVSELITPVNTFTPNGDGINDTWKISGIRNFPQADVSIYDRWGQRVYHSIGYSEPFDGAGLPTATYYWYIQVNTIKGKADPYTGYVTIVR